jgi:CubicO group peptidase (beta-lactamase class C family)
VTSSAIGRLLDRAKGYVDDGDLPTCQLAVAQHGELLAFETFGDGVTNESRFLVWSITKGVFAGLVWSVVGEGLLDYEKPVASYLPEFATNGKDVVTVEQLLLHTAGVPLAPLGPPAWFASETRREAFARWRLNWEPGSRYQYHALSAGWVLAELVIEVTGGRDYRQLLTERISEPLGLTTLRLGVPDEDQGDIVDLVVAGRRATPDDFTAAGLRYPGPPVVPPEAMLILNPPAARSVGIPSAGAVSTAADIARYYQALLANPGGLWAPDVLADGTGVVRNTFVDRPKGGVPANRTRGLVVRGSHAGAERMMHFGPGTSPRTFGHDGAGGQIAWADPETGLSFCFVSNGMEANGVTEILRCQEMATLAAACA